MINSTACQILIQDINMFSCVWIFWANDQVRNFGSLMHSISTNNIHSKTGTTTCPEQSMVLLPFPQLQFKQVSKTLSN